MIRDRNDGSLPTNTTLPTHRHGRFFAVFLYIRYDVNIGNPQHRYYMEGNIKTLAWALRDLWTVITIFMIEMN